MPGVIIASADQRHAASAAMAARSAGLDPTLIVGAALPQRHLTHLPQRLARRIPEADVTHFRGLGVAKVGRRLPGIRSSALKDRWWSSAEEHFDAWLSGWLSRGLAVDRAGYFHGFGGFVPRSQVLARDLGMRILNDVFEMHPLVERSLERRECGVMGIEPPQMSLVRAEHISRRLSAIASADVLVAGLPSVAHSLRNQGVGKPIITGGYSVPSWARGGFVNRPAIDARPLLPLRVLFVGQVHWFKGLHRALAALELLPPGSVEFTVVGALYPGPFAERIVSIAERVGRHTPVNFVGTVSKRELAMHFHRSHALLFPSLVGGIGLATLEAAAHGLPMVISDGEELFLDGESCIVSGIDAAGIAASLERVMEDPIAAEEIGQRAAHILQDRGGSGDYVASLRQFYSNEPRGLPT